MKKMPGDIIILHMCTINENHIFGPEIWSTTDRIFSQFEPCYPPLPLTTQKKNLKKWKKRLWYHHFIQQYHKWESYDVWFLRYELQHAITIAPFWAICCPFNPQTTQKTKILKKWEKLPGDIIILLICTKN